VNWRRVLSWEVNPGDYGPNPEPEDPTFDMAIRVAENTFDDVLQLIRNGIDNEIVPGSDVNINPIKFTQYFVHHEKMLWDSVASSDIFAEE
jgi:hypothetical protein